MKWVRSNFSRGVPEYKLCSMLTTKGFHPARNSGLMQVSILSIYILHYQFTKTLNIHRPVALLRRDSLFLTITITLTFNPTPSTLSHLRS